MWKIIYQLIANTSPKQFGAVEVEKNDRMDPMPDKSPTIKVIDFYEQQNQAFTYQNFNYLVKQRILEKKYTVSAAISKII